MSAQSALEEGELVGRCYTKARRHPLVLGQWEGRRLWGGPYTVPQLVTMAVVLGLMLLLRGVWAHFGLLNIVPLLAVPYAASFAVRFLHIDGRNPLAALFSVAGLAAAPRAGKVGGRPVRTSRPAPLLGSCTLTWLPAAPRARRASDVLATASTASSGSGQPRASASGGAVLSGAAALLAGRGRAGGA